MKNLLQTLLLLQTMLFSSELITPIPTHMDVDEKKVQLGKKLFFDTRLSKDNTISCAVCHDLQNGGDDGIKISFGIDGQMGTRNSPTVYNAVFNFHQFWDGRADTLQDQAVGPIENPVEMGEKLANVVKKLDATEYKQEFLKIYKDGITKENLVNAIAEYEKTLITPNAPFDLYLKGDKDAISKEAKEGYELFKTKGCIACHQGVNVGGELFNKFGVFDDANLSDLGRYEITKRESDKGYFKVPTLRNIAQTAPYFHDGRTSDLSEAVRLMANYQLGRKMNDSEVVKIVLFLKSLSGELPKESDE